MQKRKSARCLHLFVLAQVEFKKFENKLNDAEKEFKAAQTTCGAKSMEYVDAGTQTGESDLDASGEASRHDARATIAYRPFA